MIVVEKPGEQKKGEKMNLEKNGQAADREEEAQTSRDSASRTGRFEAFGVKPTAWLTCCP